MKPLDLRSRAQNAVRIARAASAVGVGSGLAFDVRPRALATLAAMRARGPLGLASLFRFHAASQPGREAIVYEGRAISYAELDARIDGLAATLGAAHGMGRGKAALLFMHNRPEFVELQAALTRLGAAAVSAQSRATADELAYLVSHSGASVIVVEDALADVVEQALRSLPDFPRKNVLVLDGARAGWTRYEDVVRLRPASVLETARSMLRDRAGDEGAVVVYTSGTTGRPKGAVRRFSSDAQLPFLLSLQELGIRHDDRHLAVCPLYHTTAFGFAGFTFVLGGTVIIEPRFEPQKFLRTVHEQRVTTSAVVPTMLHRVMELASEQRAPFSTRSLRAIFTAGAPLTGTLARTFIDAYGHVLQNIYGSTETGLNTVATSEELLRSPGTIGHAVPGNELRVLDDAGAEVPRGQTGELHVRNTMLVEYLRDPGATSASMRDGFFSVGDLAHQDEHGLFHIDGRKRDMIISGGVNVYPAEVEEVLARHPGIAEVAVVGVPDTEWGERVVAFVSPNTQAQAASAGDFEADVSAFCRAHLKGPKLPRAVHVLAELPKNPTGKILKRDLRALLE